MRALTRNLALLLIGLSITLSASLAHALSLEFNPVGQTRYVGQTALVDVRVKNPGSTLVGDYDFWVNFNPAIVQLDSILFGTGLGSADFLSFGGSDTPSPGSVNIYEVSFASDLGPYQGGGDFTLFTLAFSALNVGVSPLSFAGNIGGEGGAYIGDGWGTTYELDEIGAGSITVLGQTNPVPEPGTLLLILPGLAGIAILRHKRRNA